MFWKGVSMLSWKAKSSRPQFSSLCWFKGGGEISSAQQRKESAQLNFSPSNHKTTVRLRPAGHNTVQMCFLCMWLSIDGSQRSSRAFI